MYRGIVENNVDPSGSKRVQVRVFGVHNQDQDKVPTIALPWAEVMGSANFGLIAGVGVSSVLHIGTWVWVSFEDTEFERPVVHGVVSGVNPDGSTDLHPEVVNNPSDVQILQTKSGTIIKLIDTEGGEECSITHPTGTTIIMDSSGGMTINTASNLDISSQGLTSVQSKGDLRLFSESNVMIQGSSVQLQPGVGFALPALKEPEFPYSYTTVPFNVPEDYNIDEPDAPINPENSEDVEIAEISPLSEGELKNIYDTSIENLTLGESAWTEFGGTTKASSNPNIMALWEEMGIDMGGDSTAWCAIYLGATLKRCGLQALVTASARQYLNYPGPEIALEDAKAGDICIFWRGSKSDTVHGHVGIYTGSDTSSGRIECLGGNQGTPGRLKVSNFGINANNPGASYGLLKIVRPIAANGVEQPESSIK